MAYNTLDFGFLLHRAAYILDQQTRAVLIDKENLTLPCFLILDLIDSGRATNQQSLAELLIISKSAVSKQIDILEEQKLVRRTMLETNHKNVVVVLTSDGIAKLHHARQSLIASAQPIQAAFGDDLQNLTKQLQDLCAILDPQDRVY